MNETTSILSHTETNQFCYGVRTLHVIFCVLFQHIFNLHKFFLQKLLN